MDTRTASPPDALAATAVADSFEGQEPDKISAYYSLVFPNFTYYLQTLTVTIGRRCIPNSTASSSEQAQVDVDLGPLKSVSRLHAKIEYEEEEERFVLAVLGRNGAWVDGAWSGKGSKVPLGERSQIQIASRTFHFVLPPPPVPEDSPSPSSHASSFNRPRSPSVDITSFSPPSSIPSVSPPPVTDTPASPVKAPPVPVSPQLPNSNVNVKPGKASKKRKASDADIAPPQRPEVIPPKPSFTYAQLCYRAIKTLGGKGTLQDILTWIKENYDWYRWTEDKAWEKSVRHNLSSNRAFTKQERSVGERGKGYYWTVTEDCERSFEEQEARALAGTAGTSASGKTSGKKPKGGASTLEPALKRSVKGEPKGAPLPPPLTSAPLVFRHARSQQSSPIVKTEPVVKTEAINAPHVLFSTPQAPTAAKPAPITQLSTSPPPPTPSQPATTSTTAPASAPTALSSATGIPPIPASVILPIVIGPVPGASSGTSAAGPMSAHLATPPIVLHENQLYLDPTVFAHLTPLQLKELEALGAQKALDILHKHIVQYLKEKIKSKDGKAKGKNKNKRTKEGISGAGEGPKAGMKRERDKDKVPTTGPFTTVPLPIRRPHQPMPTPAPAVLASSPVPVDPAPPSPLLVVDDDPEPTDGPAAKRRRLEVESRDTPVALSV